MKKFLIVDDHAIIRLGIINLVSTHFQGVECMEAKDGEECILLAKEHDFELVILDLNLPDTDTLGLTEWLVLRRPETRILIFSVYPCSQYGMQYYKKGAMGFINKDADNQEMLRAMNLILNNRVYMPQDFQETISDVLLQKKNISGFERLSEREFAVAQALAKGQSYEKIAEILCIEASTVRTFKIRIFKKLGVKTLFEFLQLANSSNGIPGMSAPK